MHEMVKLIHYSYLQATENMKNTPLGSQMSYCINSAIAVFSTMYSAVPENVHTTTTEGIRISWGWEGGG